MSTTQSLKKNIYSEDTPSRTTYKYVLLSTNMKRYGAVRQRSGSDVMTDKNNADHRKKLTNYQLLKNYRYHT